MCNLSGIEISEKVKEQLQRSIIDTNRDPERANSLLVKFFEDQDGLTKDEVINVADLFFDALTKSLTA